MASTPGESRRRKNVDRGSDRLALITCQIHALPPGYPSQPLNSQDPPLHLSNKITGTVPLLSLLLMLVYRSFESLQELKGCVCFLCFHYRLIMTQPNFWAAQTSHWASFLFWKRRGGVAQRKCLYHVKLAWLACFC